MPRYGTAGGRATEAARGLGERFRYQFLSVDTGSVKFELGARCCASLSQLSKPIPYHRMLVHWLSAEEGRDETSTQTQKEVEK